MGKVLFLKLALGTIVVLSIVTGVAIWMGAKDDKGNKATCVKSSNCSMVYIGEEDCSSCEDLDEDDFQCLSSDEASELKSIGKKQENCQKCLEDNPNLQCSCQKGSCKKSNKDNDTDGSGGGIGDDDEEDWEDEEYEDDEDDEWGYIILHSIDNPVEKEKGWIKKVCQLHRNFEAYLEYVGEGGEEIREYLYIFPHLSFTYKDSIKFPKKSVFEYKTTTQGFDLVKCKYEIKIEIDTEDRCLVKYLQDIDHQEIDPPGPGRRVKSEYIIDYYNSSNGKEYCEYDYTNHYSDFNEIKYEENYYNNKPHCFRY